MSIIRKLIQKITGAFDDDWHQILTKAWSIRLLLLAGIFQGLEAAMPLIEGFVPLPPEIFALLTALSIAGAFITRLLVQSNMKEVKE